MIYAIPALSSENEFSDLGFVAKYVDRLFADTADPDFLVVYEWEDQDDGVNQDDQDYISSKPPDAVLLRVDGGWERRLVIATKRPDGDYDLSFEPTK